MDFRQRQREAARDVFRLQRGTTRCAFCEWSHEGPFVDGKRALNSHKSQRHRGRYRTKARR